MKIRWRTLGLRIFGLLAAAVLGLWLLLPALVERQIKIALKDAGLPGAKLEVGLVTPGSMTVSGLAIGDDRLRVPSATVTYSFDSLRHGRITSATIQSLIFRATLSDDMHLDLGPFNPLFGGDDDTSAGRPRFDTLTFTDAELHIDWDGRLYEIPFWGTMKNEGGKFVPNLHINVNGRSFTRPDGFIHLLGVNTDLTLVSLDPINTAPRQRITITDARIGQVRLGEVAVLFQLDGSTLRIDELLIDSPQLGKLTIMPLTVDLNDPIARVKVMIEDLDVGQTLAAASRDVSGGGRVSGWLRLRIKPLPPFRASIDGGSLAASPGTTIRFAQRKPLETILGVSAAPPTVEDAAELAKRQLVEALQDFHYTTLRIDFIPEEGQVVTSVMIDGASVTQPPRPVGPFALNISGVNDLVNTGFVDTMLRVPQWFDQAMQRLQERLAKRAGRRNGE